MFISHLKIKNLYGLLDKEIDFRNDINLLVGINGSGKTSVLNVINWLLTPSWPHLITTKFDSLELHFEYDSEKFNLFCQQDKEEVTIDIENKTIGKSYNQIQADLSYPIKKLQDIPGLKRNVLSKFEGLTPEDHEVETWEFLDETLPKPIVIGLDRNLYTEEGDQFSYLEDTDERLRRSYKRRSHSSPLKVVKDLSSQIYTEYRNNIIELNKRLKDKIMLSSFDVPFTESNLKDISNEPKVNLNQIEELEDQVKNYFQEYIIGKREESDKFYETAFQKIQNYFESLKKVVEKSDFDENKLLYVTYINQFKKTNQLIDDFEEFEEKNKLYYKSIKIYLESVNSFLRDSAKEIYFDKTSSTIKYRVFDKDGKQVEENNDVSNLSSGEKQILILFTYIKFNDKLGKIFIIDEPELSLHPKWQESFLQEIKRVMPKKTQLLFATHSPTIVGNNKEYCETLLPY